MEELEALKTGEYLYKTLDELVADVFRDETPAFDPEVFVQGVEATFDLGDTKEENGVTLYRNTVWGVIEALLESTKTLEEPPHNKDFYEDLPGAVCSTLENLIKQHGDAEWFSTAWEEYREHVKTSNMDDVRMPGYVFNKYIK